MGMFLNRGNEEFRDALNSEIYVDKSDLIAFFNKKINTEQRYISISRPRRFGKSMTANMIASYYEKGCNSRALFENLKLAETSGWDENLNKYDVIRIDFAGIRVSRTSGEEALSFIEESIAMELKKEYPEVELNEQDKALADLLSRINEQFGCRFIVVIDEWDCLFREDKNNIELQERYINLLRSLFKDNRAKKFLALGYITGILPIKKYSSESALNNFYEYTMLQPFELAPYIGFTETEVKELCEKYHMDFSQAMEWYDGYRFGDSEHICGPNSVVRSMLHREYDNYWSQTAAFQSLLSYITMNFDGLKDAIKLMLGGQRVKVQVMGYQNDMVNFRDKDDVLTVLIHLGYLAYDPQKTEAYIPNKEVRQIFELSVKDTGWKELIDTIEASEELLNATIHKDEDEVAQQIDDCHMQNTSILNYNNENALASCIMLAYYTARKEYTIIREFPSGYGFADLVFLPKPGVDKPAMIVELKWKKDAETAISQIKDRKYMTSLKDYKGRMLLVGINYEKGKKRKTAAKHTCIIEEIMK